MTMNTAALVNHILANVPDATAFHVYGGQQLEAWLKEASEHRRAVPKPAPARRKRRTSIKRLVREFRASGANVVIEQDQDGTTRVLCGDEECNAPVDYWDEKLK